jgi:protein-tyrosine phosphatase
MSVLSSNLPSNDRHVVCDGAFNVRDLGGYTTADGKTVRWQTLYRADGLHRIPAEAAHAVAPLGWRTVLDLRTKGEFDDGAFAHAAEQGAEVIHLPVIREPWDITAVDDAEPADFLASRYLDMLDEGVEALTTAVELLASPTRLPAVFHCSAGKDRTGVLAALVLSVVGVPDEQIAQDYQLSASAMDKLVAWLVAAHPDRVDHMAQQPTTFLQCPPEAMFTFLERLRERFGSAEGYLTASGLDPEVPDRLRGVLLEP